MSTATVPASVEILPGYEVIAHLRRGEDTDVYDAWSHERDCRCIVKTLVPGASRTARARLLREGQMLVHYTHPNLVRGYEVHTSPVAAVVMETVTGETLGHLIAYSGRSPLAELCALGVHVSSVLGYLHRDGVLHLDVKPSNIVCQEEQAKLLDLGIAGAFGRSRGYGTPAYMAPEQRRGGIIGPATDVWGLGVTLYEAATGAGPFSADDPLPGRTASPIGKIRRLPRPVADVIDSCLAPVADDRPELRELADVLRHQLD